MYSSILRKTIRFKILSYIVIASFCIAYSAQNAIGVEFLSRGADDSNTAAQCKMPAKDQEKSFYSFADIKASTPPDSLEQELLEEERGKHLARDITIFVVLSAFVGYFLVKVFLEGDKGEPAAKKNGKDKPPFMGF